MKPAGGIRTSKQALAYLVMVKETLGDDWLTPGLVPLRREHTRQRRAHANRQKRGRKLSRLGLFFTAMKTKLKPVKISAQRAVATIAAHPVVPLKERRLNFGNKWDYAPAPEDSKNYVIAPRHELFIDGKFVAPHVGRNIFHPSTRPRRKSSPKLRSANARTWTRR